MTDRKLKCPRDGAELRIEHYHGIEVDRCHTCNGRWLDHEELDKLEATVPSTEEERRATIEYGEKQSEINCPVCQKQLTTFNYRAYDLELDTCSDGDGYWLDTGEENRVRDIIEERVRDLGRASRAEAGWGRFLKGLGGKASR
jgi:Zn-finger nucleic acid-binding protein